MSSSPQITPGSHENPSLPKQCYEDFVAELSLRFVNLAGEQVDGAIEDAQRFFCQYLELERSSLHQFLPAEPESLLLTHVYEQGDNSAATSLAEKRFDSKLGTHVYWVQDELAAKDNYRRFDAGPMFPWVYSQIRRGEPVVAGTLADLPSEKDQASFRRFGTRSTVIMPLLSEGKPIGCISFATFTTTRKWSGTELKRFRFVADMFTNALIRKRTDEALRRSEYELRSLYESMRDAYVSTDLTGRILETNLAYQQLVGYSEGELLTMSYQDITPQRWHAFEAELVQTQVLGRGYSDVFEKEYRRKDGTVFPAELRAFLLRDEAGQPSGMWAIVRDITERKTAQEALLRSFQEIKQLKDRLQAETDYLKAEIKLSHVHGQILGRTEGIRRVLHDVEQVAPADCPVLISGETGTGKELIAQEIHRLSQRHDRLMVLVNCAALPSALVESELFGRERGAYTGALTSQVGRFEVADSSSIFLDEVGELSLEVQAKLLHVLQHGQYQRLGSPKTHKVNVRVIAATNRDLADEIRKGRFREDLYYRLSVFPIKVPPLRERLEDLPSLVFAFIEEFSQRMGKKVTKIPRRAMEVLERHTWPGNIRELRNVIEHSVILTPGDTLKLSMLAQAPARESQPMTLAEAEREHILKTLESTNWRIKGAHGAAARLDVQPSTLYSRMQRLGIPHRRQKEALALR